MIGTIRLPVWPVRFYVPPRLMSCSAVEVLGSSDTLMARRTTGLLGSEAVHRRLATIPVAPPSRRGMRTETVEA